MLIPFVNTQTEVTLKLPPSTDLYSAKDRSFSESDFPKTEVIDKRHKNSSKSNTENDLVAKKITELGNSNEKFERIFINIIMHHITNVLVNCGPCVLKWSHKIIMELLIPIV